LISGSGSKPTESSQTEKSTNYRWFGVADQLGIGTLITFYRLIGGRVRRVML